MDEQTKNLPVLQSFRSPDGIQDYVWCPFCCCYHTHGAGDGFRAAHCGDRRSPFYETGYILVCIGEFTPKLRWARKTPRPKENQIIRCPRCGSKTRVTASRKAKDESGAEVRFRTRRCTDNPFCSWWTWTVAPLDCSRPEKISVPPRRKRKR